MSEKRIMKLASRGKRLGAFCLDAIVPGILSICAIVAYGLLLSYIFAGFGRYGRDIMDDFGYGYGYDYGYGNGFGYGYNGGGADGTTITTLMTIIAVVGIAYAVVQIIFFRKSQTIGKALLGLEVVSSKDGRPIGFWMMLLREWIVKRASYIFLLGFIWVFIDDKNRGWHDKILDTYVVDKKESARLRSKSSAIASDPGVRSIEEDKKDELVAMENDRTMESDESIDNIAISIESVIEPVKSAADDAVAKTTIEKAEAAEQKEPTGAKESAKVKELAKSKEVVETKNIETSAPKTHKANMSMKKDDLLEIADDLGLKVDPGMTKAQIIELLEDAAAKENKG